MSASPPSPSADGPAGLAELARRGRRTLPAAPRPPRRVFIVGRGIRATAEAYIEDLRVRDDETHVRLLLEDGDSAEAVLSTPRARELGLAPQQIALVRFEQR